MNDLNEIGVARRRREGGDRRCGRGGFAGFMLVILALGLLVSLGFSLNYMMQTEAGVGRVRHLQKQAFYAALAGLQFAVNRLQVEPVVNTFDGADPPKARLYFCRDGTAPFDGTYTNLFVDDPAGRGVFHSTLALAGWVSDSNMASAAFRLSTFPQVGQVANYWAKVQGYAQEFDDTGVQTATWTAQVWGLIKVDTTAKTVRLVRYSPMAVQKLAHDATAANDFWDWQYFL